MANDQRRWDTAEAVELMRSVRALDAQRGRLRDAVRARPALTGSALFLAIAVALLIANGPNAFGQTTVFGVVSGSYFALGAVGLTLVYGVLRLVNFAHGDFLTSRSSRQASAYRGSVFVSSTTCWNVGRFWNGNGGTVIALALIQRFMSKQLACASSAQTPLP